jgi:hypothetical protein
MRQLVPAEKVLRLTIVVDRVEKDTGQLPDVLLLHACGIVHVLMVEDILQVSNVEGGKRNIINNSDISELILVAQVSLGLLHDESAYVWRSMLNN